jgi:hypothetical protein
MSALPSKRTFSAISGFSSLPTAITGTPARYLTLAGGIPKHEGLTRPGATVLSGVLWELTNVKEIEPDVIE